MLKEIDRPPSFAAQAKTLMADAILSGERELGAHLVETRLASEFQISRGPIREALNALAADGLVTMRPGRGAFVGFTGLQRPLPQELRSHATHIIDAEGQVRHDDPASAESA